MFKSACVTLYAPVTEHSAEVEKRQPFREKILDFNKMHVQFQKNPERGAERPQIFQE